MKNHAFVGLFCYLNWTLAFASISPMAQAAQKTSEKIQISQSKAISEEKEWTLLVYLNGNNSLDQFSDMNLKQMEQIGSSEKINVVVQWASLRQNSVRRYFVQKSSDPTRVSSPVLEDLGPVDMGDAQSLLDFLKWGAQKFPAKKYFVDVWNHGTGWHNPKMPLAQQKTSDFNVSDISQDDRTKHKITTEQLGEVLKNFSLFIGKKIEVYGSDACLMGMIEVASEMKDHVNFFAGSQDLEPGQGWPYSTFLKEWNDMADSGGGPVVQMLAEEYLKAYSGGIYGESDVTFSAFDLSEIQNFEKALERLGSEILSLEYDDLRKVAALSRQTQFFTDKDYRDLMDFLKNLKEEKVQLSAGAVSDLEQSYRRFVIANQVSREFEKAQGVSIWIPTTLGVLQKYKDRYEKLKFNLNTQWLKVILRLPMPQTN